MLILIASMCEAVLFVISGRGWFLAGVVSDPFLSGCKVCPRGIEREAKIGISLFEVGVRILYYYYFTESGCGPYGSSATKRLLMSLLIGVRGQ